MSSRCSRLRGGASLVALSALVGVASASATAAAHEPDAGCGGARSIRDPLPDACLEAIDTDRPHQTDTPHVVPAGHTQVESALASLALGGALRAAPGDRAPRLLLLENNYKFGLVSHFDLQISTNHAEYDFGRERLAPPGPVGVRAKFNVVEQDGWLPTTTLVPWIVVPASSSQTLRGGPHVFWGWELPHHFELEVNTGVFFNARPKPPAVLVLASALTYTIVGNLRTFIDVYATGWDVVLGTGVLWAFVRDVQIDAGTYVGLTGDVTVATPFVGLSVRR